MAAAPTVTLVFLVYNRREELRTSLTRMLADSDYARERVDAVVVDNGSTDGSADMVAAEFPSVRLIRRAGNAGISGWNDGFAVARGDWVLALDDDCHLPPDGLRRALDSAREHGADLVSFAVRSAVDPAHRFDHEYRTGLLSFWGCAVLMRRQVLEELGGFDPEIFIWAHELEFMLRFFDRGFRHLHLPEVEAQHMKAPLPHWTDTVRVRSYRVNFRHLAYVAGKLLRPRDALEALIALVATAARDGLSVDKVAFGAIPAALGGFARGLARRAPVRADVSRLYRRNFESFASPWWISRPPRELLRALPGELRRARSGAATGGDTPPPSRAIAYYESRRSLYPTSAATLQL